ncbi:hypothetical protein NKI48_31115 [Mesorhizobium sp. M0644]|uniref:hypothetical protein n=1 Tax=unclassified Mesorhizobium TaxID=325217 RepID=UPI0033378A65
MLKAPAIDATVFEKADWLEFRSFFDEYHQARVDEVLGALAIQAEESEDNIGQRDIAIEEERAEIALEIAARESGLREAYPFRLSRTGEVLELKERQGRRAGRFYLLCLVLSHVTRSRILETVPHDSAIAAARNHHFQCIATLAMAGQVQGPSVWMGWPRPTDESILEVVGRACGLAQTGSRRDAAGPTASEYDKDGGIDVIGWQPFADGPPPAFFAFGQTASGHNWPGKSAFNDSEALLRGYFQDRPNCQFQHFTIVPHRLSAEDMAKNAYRHGAILDRTRTPLMAWRGLALSRGGVHVDCSGAASVIWRWLRAFRRFPEEAYNAA